MTPASRERISISTKPSSSASVTNLEDLGDRTKDDSDGNLSQQACVEEFRGDPAGDLRKVQHGDGGRELREMRLGVRDSARRRYRGRCSWHFR